jgi:hypothetical protein
MRFDQRKRRTKSTTVPASDPISAPPPTPLPPEVANPTTPPHPPTTPAPPSRWHSWLAGPLVRLVASIGTAYTTLAQAIGHRIDRSRPLAEQIRNTVSGLLMERQQWLGTASDALMVTQTAPYDAATVAVEQAQIALEQSRQNQRRSRKDRDQVIAVCSATQQHLATQRTQILAHIDAVQAILAQRVAMEAAVRPNVSRTVRRQQDDLAGGAGLLQRIAALQRTERSIRTRMERRDPNLPDDGIDAPRLARIRLELEQTEAERSRRAADPTVAQGQASIAARDDAWRLRFRQEAERTVVYRMATGPSALAPGGSPSQLPEPIPLPAAPACAVVAASGFLAELPWERIGEGRLGIAAVAAVAAEAIVARQPRRRQGRQPILLSHGVIALPMRITVQPDGTRRRCPVQAGLTPAVVDQLARSLIRSRGADPDRHGWVAWLHHGSGEQRTPDGDDDAELAVHVAFCTVRDDGAILLSHDAAIAAVVGRARWDVAAGFDALRGMDLPSRRKASMRQSLQRLANGTLTSVYLRTDGSREAIPLQSDDNLRRYADDPRPPFGQTAGTWTWKRGAITAEAITALIIYLTRGGAHGT